MGAFDGLRLGSLSAACAAHAHCPVLVVPPTTHDAVGSAASTAAGPD